jgi:hypothetical protein
MEIQIEPWRDLYVMLGTSSAALLGLLYVVTSLHLDEIARNSVYRMRARSNSLYLIITLIEAALVLTPQPLATLGSALILDNLFGLSVNVRNTYRFLRNRDVSVRGGMAFYRALSFMLGFLLGIAGGAFLSAGMAAGLYLVTASYVALLVGVALNAWAIMVGIGLTEQNEKRSAGRPKKRA